MRRFFLFLPLLLIGGGLSAQDLMTPELLWKMARVGGPVVSPDGQQVLYTLTRYDLQANKGNTDLYVVPASGGEPRQVTNLPGSEYGAHWRPDGQKIGFLYAGEERPQAYEINLDGTGLKQITSVEGGIGNFRYAPSGDYIMYTHQVKLEPNIHDVYPDLPKSSARIIDDMMFRHWDTWEDGKWSHIFIAPYSNGEVTGEAIDIMKDEPYDSPLSPFGGQEELAWSPDGKTVAYTCKKESGKEYAISTNSNIYLYNRETGETRNLTEDNLGYDKQPVFSPDGSKLAWLSMARAGYESDRNRLKIYDFNTDETTELTAGWTYSASSPAWSPDGKKVYFLAVIDATEQIFQVDLKRKEIEQLTEGMHDYVAVAPAGKNTLIGARRSISHPVDLYRVEVKDGSATAITQANRDIYNALKVGKVEKVMVESTDGKEVLTWMIYPPDFDPNKKYPTLLYCQGGPQSPVSQFFSYRWNFQLMAANGYIVVAPNRRGLPGFGQEWNEQISGDWGGQAMDDLLAAVDYAAELPYVDEESLGAVGASFGGYTVYWLAGNHGGRFKSFISHCGLYNLESWYAATEETFFADWDIKGAPWDIPQPKSYALYSPNKFVRNWDTPLLVIHGEKDFRVPINQGIEAFQAAQLQDVPSRFLYFPDEGHWVQQPQNGVVWHRVFFGWLDQWLKE